MLYAGVVFMITSCDIGVRNKQSVGSSSTMGGSSRCVRGFWRTDSQTRTVDSDMRSLMSLEDMSDLCQALPIEA